MADEKHKTDKPADADEFAEVEDLEQEQKIGEKSESANSEDTGQVDTELPKEPEPEKKTAKTWLQSVWHWLVDHKKVSMPLLVVVVLAALASIPFTRYAVAGLVLKKNYQVMVVDSQTSKPVSSAEVSVGSTKVKTDKDGKATIKLAVGSREIKAAKKYYKDSSLATVVPILKQKDVPVIKLAATGRPVSIQVKNFVTGKAVADVKVKAADTEVKTDKDGKAEIVLPAGKAVQEATLSAEGYNDAKVNIQVNGQTFIEVNSFKITPAGKIYFLSNKTGSLDVVKANLDGTDRKTVLQGTGNEVKPQTSLLASRDWKYLALISRRDGGEYDKLFLIDTSNDKITTMDEGKATFSLLGWNGHRFVYSVDRAEVKYWQPNRVALKSFNAESGQLSTLDQTTASGSQNSYSAQFFESPTFIGDSLLYVVSTNGTANPILRTVQASGQGKKDIKTFSQLGHAELSIYEPNSIYVTYNYWDQAASKPVYSYYEYEDNTLKELKEASKGTEYYTYLQSPSADNVFWSESRDGKNALFVGDKEAKFPKEVANGDYQVYGWYGDKYLLATQKSSELYILSVDGSGPIKITDYYKPNITYRGYGGGYGGF